MPPINTQQRSLSDDKYTHFGLSVHLSTVVGIGYRVYLECCGSQVPSGLPAVTANQRHEHARIVLLLGVARSGPVDDGEVLKARRADRNNKSAAVAQLFSQGVRDRGCSGRDHYPIE